jgi:hypothetical protein
MAQDNPFAQFLPSPEPTAQENPFSSFVPPAEAPKEGGFLSAVYENVIGSGEVDTIGEKIGRGFTDISRGILAAPISLVQGLLETGAAGIDISLGTNTARTVTNAAEGLKSSLDLEAQSGWGKGAEAVTAFGLGFVPIVGWLGRANAVAKGVNVTSKSRFLKTAEAFGRSAAGKAVLGNRAKLAGTTAAAYGGYSMLFSPDGRSSFSDAVSWMPEVLRTEDTSNLSGPERALALLRNKARLGIEDGAFSLGFDAALAGAGAGVRAASGPASQVLRSAKKTAAFQKAYAGLDALGKTTVGQTAKDKFNYYFSPYGGAPRELISELKDVRARAMGAEGLAQRLVTELDSEMMKLQKAAGVRGRLGRSPSQVQTDVHNYMLGQGTLNNYPPRVKKIADTIAMLNARVTDEQIFELEEIVRRINDILRQPGGGAYKGLPRKELMDRRDAANEALNLFRATQASGQNHMRRLYEMHERPENFYANLDLTSPLFNQAVDEVATNSFSYLSQAAARNEAKKVVYDALGLQAINKGTPPEEALKEIIEGYKKIKPGRVFQTERAPLARLHEGLFIERKAPLDKTPALRALMGEITDPREVAFRTISDLAQTSAAMKFYRTVSRSGFVEGVDTAWQKLLAGGRPALVRIPDASKMTASEFADAMKPFADEAVARMQANPAATITPDDVLREYVDALTSRNYRPLSSEGTSRFVTGGPFGELTGMYASPETYRAMTTAQIGQNFGMQALAVFNQFRAAAQRATVTLNPASRVRDALGSFGMLTGSGNMARDMDFAGHFQLVMSSLLDLDEAGLARLVEKLELSGVRNTQPLLNIISKLRTEGAEAAKGTGLRQMSKGLQFMENLPIIREVGDAFEDIASLTDFVMKTAALASEEQSLRTIFANAKVPTNDEAIWQLLVDAGVIPRTRSQLLTRSQILTRDPKTPTSLDFVETVASDLVREVLPNYGMVGIGVKELLERVPFGNFSSFALETIRNSVNIVSFGLNGLAFEIPEAAARVMDAQYGAGAAAAFERGVRARGAERLASYASVAFIAPRALVHAGMAATGTTPEQMEAVHQYADDFFKGRNLMPVGNDGKGTVQVVNIDTILPYAYAFEGAQAGLQAYGQQGRLGKSEAEQIASGLWRGLWVYAEPFTSESIVFEHLRDALPRGALGVGGGGETVEGRIIWRETDSPGVKIAKGLAHMFEAIKPAYLDPFISVGGSPYGMSPGNLMRGVTGLPGSRGQAIDAQAEIGKIVTGATPIELNLPRDLYFKGSDYAKLRSDMRNAALNTIKAPDVGKDMMLSTWDSYLDKLYALQSRLYSDIEAARTLGVEDRVIRYNLTREANLGSKEVNQVMRGMFAAPKPDDELGRDIRRRVLEGWQNRVVKDPPIAEIFQRSRERSQETLSPLMYRLQDFKVQPDANPFQQFMPGDRRGSAMPASPVGAANAAPVVVPMPEPVVPQTPPAPANRASVSPILLGENPFEQAANQAVAQSLSGQ